MSIPDSLFLGPPIPHATNGATTFGTNAVNVSATSIASATVATTQPSLRYASVCNLDATKVLYVRVGTNTATAGDLAVFPKSTAYISLSLADFKGTQPNLNILASDASCLGSVQWYR